MQDGGLRKGTKGAKFLTFAPPDLSGFPLQLAATTVPWRDKKKETRYKREGRS